MDQAILFAVLTLALAATIWRRNVLAIVLWCAALVVLGADYLFHATSRLPLSF